MKRDGLNVELLQLFTQLFKAYALLSMAWYVISRPVRFALGDRLRLTYWQRFLVTAAIATCGWGFVIVRSVFMVNPDGTKPANVTTISIIFYAITLGGFAGALALDRAADIVAAAGRNLVVFPRQAKADR